MQPCLALCDSLSDKMLPWETLPLLCQVSEGPQRPTLTVTTAWAGSVGFFFCCAMVKLAETGFFLVFISDNQRFLLPGLHPGRLPADVYRKDFCSSLPSNSYMDAMVKTGEGGSV